MSRTLTTKSVFSADIMSSGRRPSLTYIHQIIKRARENFFFKTYQDDHPKIDDKVVEDTCAAFTFYGKEKIPGFSELLKPADFEGSEWAQKYAALQAESTLNETDTRLKVDLAALSRAAVGLNMVQNSSAPEVASKFYEEAKSVLVIYLDSQLMSTLPEDAYSVFSAHSRYWEKHFYEDLKTLNCLPPTILTRVSEFIPENVEFVEKIVKNGFAYPVDGGSVYFDVSAFEAAGNPYPRLEPWSRPDESHSRGGEAVGGREVEIEGQQMPDNTGDPIANANKKLKVKKNAIDFALWKGSEPGQPSWESPWGRGRPGWHIECSAMCSKVLGSQIDIHSGGIDLAFPHHDNELAQAEAFWACDGKQHQWVNYFIHMGHLSIAGSKMSKSLKNFISIRDAMASGEWTARRLRIIFMMGGWRDGIEITKEMRRMAEVWETSVSNFFISVKALAAEEAEKETAGAFIPHYFRSQEQELYTQLVTISPIFYDLISDNILQS
jgi:cysteinyl-tRNA synthetase